MELLGLLESTQWDTDLIKAKGRACPLIDFFPPSAHCASPVSSLPQVRNIGDQAAETVLQMVRPQVSLVLSIFCEFLSLRPRIPVARAVVPNMGHKGAI